MASQQNQERQQTMYWLVEEQLKSGMSQKKFSQQKQISLHVFRYWYKKYQQQFTEKEQRFIPLKINPSADSCTRLQIQYPNGVNLYLPASLDMQTIKTLINSI